MRRKTWAILVIGCALFVFLGTVLARDSKRSEVLNVLETHWSIPLPDMTPIKTHSNIKNKKREAIMGYIIYELDDDTYREIVARIRLEIDEEYHPESIEYLDGYTAQSLGLVSDYGKLEKKLKKFNTFTTWLAFKEDSSDAVCIVADYTQNLIIYIVSYEIQH
ncbi:hypothetical protein AOC36_11275 [Erysipelothrix larvae]|uniref:Uncharacterized protein n=1 Tax=Erysipelothrix larvae TaxID=1514105 RepID=A0A109UHP0_9FIRM|nr:hypothetical protein [Erysipelothrix larvae]AMC94531.1 hypothetical protein AOC36_11275 [Erysipelothrix larvae]